MRNRGRWTATGGSERSRNATGLPVSGPAWMTPARGDRWHAVGRAEWGPVVVAACGHPLCGQVRRVLTDPRQLGDGRAICADCLAVVEPPDERIAWPPEDHELG